VAGLFPFASTLLTALSACLLHACVSHADEPDHGCSHAVFSSFCTSMWAKADQRSQPVPSDSAKRQALHDFLKCAIQHEPEMDDGTSDASTIALGLTNRCGTEYSAVTKLFAPPSHQAALQWQQQQATPQAKIEASLDVVLSMRRGAVPNPAALGR
jgi:hypothetical protein